MNAHLLLNDLLSQGLRLLADGDKLRVRGRLTDELRQQIRAHKAELLALLTENQAATTAQEATSAPTSASPIPAFAHFACSACMHLHGGACLMRGFYPVLPHIAMRLCSDFEARELKELVQGGQEGGR